MNTIEISKQYKVPHSVVDFESAKIKADLTEKGLTGADLEGEVEELLHHVLRTMTSKSKGELYTGMILAMDKIKDNAQPFGKPTKRQAQVDAYIANPEETIAAGKVAVLVANADGMLTRTMKSKKTGTVFSDVVTPDIWKNYTIPVGDTMVVPLDDMQHWPKSGKENFSYLHNLPLHEYKTTLVIVLKGEDGYKLAELQYNSEIMPAYIPMNIAVDFVATPKEPKDGVMQLSNSKFTVFEPSVEPFGKTSAELMQAFLGGIRYKLDKLEAYHTSMVKAGKQWDTLVLVEAYVSDIRGLDKRPYLLINDNTTEAPVQVWLNDSIDINFGINSKVFIIGKTSQGDKYDAATKTKLRGVPGDVSINAMGVVPKFNTAPANLKPITGL